MALPKLDTELHPEFKTPLKRRHIQEEDVLQQHNLEIANDRGDKRRKVNATSYTFTSITDWLYSRFPQVSALFMTERTTRSRTIRDDCDISPTAEISHEWTIVTDGKRQPDDRLRHRHSMVRHVANLRRQKSCRVVFKSASPVSNTEKGKILEARMDHVTKHLSHLVKVGQEALSRTFDNGSAELSEDEMFGLKTR